MEPMTKPEAREILYHFAIFCASQLKMRKIKFDLLFEDLDTGLFRSELTKKLTMYGWVPSEIVEANQVVPECIEHCGEWAWGGRKNGRH